MSLKLNGCNFFLIHLVFVSGFYPFMANAQITDREQPVAALPTRELWGDALHDAREMRDQADLLRSQFEKKYRWKLAPSSSQHQYSPDSEEARSDYNQVVRAYRATEEKYPHTKTAAQSQLRLSGLQQYRRDWAAAATTSEEVGEAYAGTLISYEAYIARGLIDLQGRHDPQGALEWFKKVPPTPEQSIEGNNGSEVGAHATLYAFAQQLLAKAEHLSGQGVRAEARLLRLGESYPRLAEVAIDQFEQHKKDHLRSKFRVDVDEILDESLAFGSMFTRERKSSLEGIYPLDGGVPHAETVIRSAGESQTQSSQAQMKESSLQEVDIVSGLPKFWIGATLVAFGTGSLSYGIYLSKLKKQRLTV